MTSARPANHIAPRTAVIAGATGLIGGELVVRLLREPRYAPVVALSRRPLKLADGRLEVFAADYDHLDRRLKSVAAAGRPLDVFCCLGTTIRAAGSEAAFRRVDHDYVLALGRWAMAAHADRMVVVSALGADAGSRVFYNRVKGETERALAALGLPTLVLARPSLLRGKRSEFRFGERLALAVTRPIERFIPARARPIAAADVAQAMLDAALADAPPAVLDSSAMQGAAQRRSASRRP
jgi:uncharacterized protein YbjT (DUF2867 family)